MIAQGWAAMSARMGMSPGPIDARSEDADALDAGKLPQQIMNQVRFGDDRGHAQWIKRERAAVD